MMDRRVLGFAQCAVAVESDGQRASGLVEFLFRDVPSDDPSQPYTSFRVEFGDDGTAFSVSRDGSLLSLNESEGDFAENLLGYVTIALADKSQGGPVYHAGALAWNGAAIVLPGAVGAGKTTLTAWLVTQGLNYLTDEMVWVPAGTDLVHGFARPLNLKKPSRPPLSGVFDFDKHAAQFLSGSRTDLIPPGVLRPGNRTSSPRLGLLLFPRYRSGAAGEIRRLTKAQAGFALAKTMVNARNLPEQGMNETARLAQTTPAFEIEYADFRQVQPGIERLLNGFDGGEKSPANFHPGKCD